MTEIFSISSLGTPILIIEGHATGITLTHTPEPDTTLSPNAVQKLHAALGKYLENLNPYGETTTPKDSPPKNH